MAIEHLFIIEIMDSTGNRPEYTGFFKKVGNEYVNFYDLTGSTQKIPMKIIRNAFSDEIIYPDDSKDQRATNLVGKYDFDPNSREY